MAPSGVYESHMLYSRPAGRLACRGHKYGWVMYSTFFLDPGQVNRQNDCMIRYEYVHVKGGAEPDNHVLKKIRSRNK